MAMALVGVLAYRSLRGRGELAELLGQNSRRNRTRVSGDGSLGSGGLDSLFGGGIDEILPDENVGGTVSDGLCYLLLRFEQNGQGDKAWSWVSVGRNRPISPSEMEQGLGRDTVRWLTDETGMAKDQLLSGLSRYLPECVDRLTPNGQLPSAAEAAQQLKH
jgi:uncharacterized protein YidB (DUF937 family)